MSDGCSCLRWPPLSTGQGQFLAVFTQLAPVFQWAIREEYAVICLLLLASVLLLCQDISHMISLFQDEWYLLTVFITPGSWIMGGYLRWIEHRLTHVWLPSIVPLRWEPSKTSCVWHLWRSVPAFLSGVWGHLVEIWELSEVRLQFLQCRRAFLTSIQQKLP